jgi:hypothetical protein
MFDSFPFDEWSEDIADFWAWGGANSTGTYIMTVLGIILMVAALYGFVILERGKLERQAAALRAAGGLGPAPPANPTGSH